MKNTKLFLYYPILFLVLLFFIDKVFTIPFFKNDFIQTGNIEYYRHRPILFDRLKKTDLKNKDLIIAFGDSRAYAYSELAFDKERKNKYTVYNFAAPQAVTAYSLFWLQKMVEDKLIPKLVILVVSPEGFDDSKGLYNSPFLRMGADENFIHKYYSHFPKNEMEEYEFDRLISFRKLEFNYKLFFELAKKNNFKEYSTKTNSRLSLLDISNGAQLAYMSFANDIKLLEKDTLRIKNIYLGSKFKVDDTSFFFIKELLELAKKNNIKVFTVWPRVYPSYKLEYDKLDFDTKFGKKLKDITEENNAKYFDLNKDLICDEYYDASHQSVSCFGKNLNFFVDELEKIK